MKSLPLLFRLCFTAVLWCQFRYDVTAQTTTPIQLYGVNYNLRQGPDWDWEKCKSLGQIKQELTILSQITSRIRLLSMRDCQQAEILVELAPQYGLSVYLGMWNNKEQATFDAELVELERLIDSGLVDESYVDGITVGSEAILRGDVTPSQAIRDVVSTQTLLADKGLDLPVGVCDIANILKDRPPLISASDVPAVNIFPFWEQEPIETALEGLLGNGIWQALGEDKPFIIGETGWSAQGSNRFASEATVENQVQFFKDFYCQISVERGWSYYWFTSFDNDWRQEQNPNVQDNVEGHFGIFYSSGQLKEHYQSLRFSCEGNDSVEYAFVVEDVTIEPTEAPSVAQSSSPTRSPSLAPTNSPTSMPSANPTPAPSKLPTPAPTKLPSQTPTMYPTDVGATPRPTPPPTSFPPFSIQTASPTILVEENDTPPTDDSNNDDRDSNTNGLENGEPDGAAGRATRFVVSMVGTAPSLILGFLTFIFV